MVIEAFVDRIEGDVAVLLVRDGAYSIAWPAALLPDDTREGSVIEVSLAVNQRATEQAKSASKSLIDGLVKND